MKRSRLTPIVAILFLVLAGMVRAADIRPFEAQPLHSFETGAYNTSPTQGAAGYIQWFNTCLNGLEGDMPNISASAQAAANRYVNTGSLIYVGGDGLEGEISWRAGGLMLMNPFGLSSAMSNSILLVFPSVNTLDTDLGYANTQHNLGNMVIVFASKAALQRATALNYHYDATIETHAAPNGGLYRMPDGSWVVNTDTPSKIIAVWTWTAEFVGACMRLGKMPICWESVAVPGGYDRDLGPYCSQSIKFHDWVPQQPATGQLGTQYLRELGKIMGGIAACDLEKIHQAAAMAVSAKRSGHAVYLYAFGHSESAIVPCPYDTGLFFQINTGWATTDNPALKSGYAPQQGDFVLCVSYDFLYRGANNGSFVEMCRTAGAGLAHGLTSYNQSEVNAILPGEVFIDEHWALGDAIVYPPGYDIKICAPSGVIEHSLFWMVNAETLRLFTAK